MFDPASRRPAHMGRRSVAIIGSGISGLSAAWMLHPHHDIMVFESETSIGGHSHTINVGTEDEPLWVDMGFIVFNEPCYPNLTALFAELGVAHELTDMSFGVSVDQGGLEYGSLGLKGLFAQRRNLFRPRFLSLLLDIVRFYREAPRDVQARSRPDYRLGDYLRDRNYGRAFIDDHLLPQAAAIWSATATQIMDYPFQAFVTFFENHGLLKLSDRILWRSVEGGAQAYVKVLITPLADRIRTSTPVWQVIRDQDGVTVMTGSGAERFDEVIFATHADISLRLLGDASADERRILSAFPYTSNEVVLHTDANLMPKRRAAWSAWNYIGLKDELGDTQLCVTYWMNLLQRLKSPTDYFVTLNPRRQIDPDKVIRTVTFEHPLFNPQALAAQGEVGRIQGVRHSWYCGAWMGAGFHEDGLQAGLAVAEALSGLQRPWAFDPGQSRIGWKPQPLAAPEPALI